MLCFSWLQALLFLYFRDFSDEFSDFASSCRIEFTNQGEIHGNGGLFDYFGAWNEYECF